MDRIDIARLEHAGRSAMARDVNDEFDHNLARLLGATLPALGILATCALMLVAAF